METAKNDHELSPEKKPSKNLKYPKAVFFIISNEFCERFSYYGMRAILALYLAYLGFTEDQSTMIYHTFVMLCYFAPLIGGVVADAYLGKYKTILYVSLYYAVGNIMLSAASVKSLDINHVVASLIGLFVIGTGTGGIKPCVSAFGGDQFVLPEQERQLEAFFSVFYFAINAGSVISSFLSPVLRENVACFGDDVCYPLAFGVPAFLMCLSVVIFVGGKSMYKINPPSDGNVALDVVKCCSYAVTRKVRTMKHVKKGHWLDYAEDKFSRILIEDTKIVLKMIALLGPTVVFWALFEQQGSRWTFQAKHMDGDIGFFVIQPDQMQTINPVLCLTFIPIFESLIYPLLSKLKIVRSPLQKMVYGGILAAVAFIISGLLELKIEESDPILPSEGIGHLRLYNSLNCPVSVRSDNLGINSNISSFGTISFPQIPITEFKNYTLEAKYGASCNEKDAVLNFALESKKVSTYMFTRNGGVHLMRLGVYGEEDVARSKDGSPKIRLVYGGGNEKVTVLLQNNLDTKNISISDHVSSQEKLKSSSDYSLIVNGKLSNSTIRLKSGGVYTLLLNDLKDINFSLFVVTEPYKMNMLWQLPQYIVITAAEIMFSITGLQFCFTQAPVSMKSVMSSLWLLTNSLGNIVILVIAGVKIFEKQSSEFFLFAGLMALVMLLFIFLAKNYKYVDFTTQENQSDQQNATTEVSKI
ncbi:peptide transporter family 1-like isoform X2 [Cimex lectularius]|nr:peptide transporter family 1-like isoform X2 [Cimex lectularius]